MHIIEGIEILLSLEKNRLSIKAGGFVKQENLKNVLNEIVKANTQLKDNAGVLLDLTEFKVSEKAGDIEALLPKILSKVKYVATIYGDSPITKMQVSNLRRRIQVNVEREYFDTFDDAMKWLDLMQNKLSV